LIRLGNSIITGNSELTPERNTQFDVGLAGDWEFFRTGARAFHSNIDNYILYRRTGFAGTPDVANPERTERFTSRTYEYINIERASLYGGDVSAEVQLSEYLSVGATVSYVKGTNHSPGLVRADTGAGVDPDNPPAGIPLVEKSAEGLPNIFPLNGTISIRIAEPKENKWGFEVLTRLSKRQDFLADSLVEAPTPGFGIVDLRAYAELRKNLRVTSTIENLFDRVYTQHGSLAIVDRSGLFSFVKEPGINWRLGVEVEY
jgi:iron complex outermembrane receptor protein